VSNQWREDRVNLRKASCEGVNGKVKRRGGGGKPGPTHSQKGMTEHFKQRRDGVAARYRETSEGVPMLDVKKRATIRIRTDHIDGRMNEKERHRS